MLHIRRCALTKRTLWHQPHVSSSFLSKVIGKKRTATRWRHNVTSDDLLNFRTEDMTVKLTSSTEKSWPMMTSKSDPRGHTGLKLCVHFSVMEYYRFTIFAEIEESRGQNDAFLGDFTWNDPFSSSYAGRHILFDKGFEVVSCATVIWPKLRSFVALEWHHWNTHLFKLNNYSEIENIQLWHIFTQFCSLFLADPISDRRKLEMMIIKYSV